METVELEGFDGKFYNVPATVVRKLLHEDAEKLAIEVKRVTKQLNKDKGELRDKWIRAVAELEKRVDTVIVEGDDGRV